jgi:hypothetical protein
MGHDKAIQYGKEKRKPYRKGKAISNHCRNHGCCSWCVGNRLHKREVQEFDAEEKLTDIELIEDDEEEDVNGIN